MGVARGPYEFGTKPQRVALSHVPASSAIRMDASVGEAFLSTHLTDRLALAGIPYDVLSKSEKVQLLTRWNSVFRVLSDTARRGILSPGVLTETKVEEFLTSLPEGTVYGFLMTKAPCHRFAVITAPFSGWPN